MFEAICDVLSVLCVLLAGILSASAGVGLLRFRDSLSRLHAATKPQLFGLLLIILAVALDQRSVVVLLALAPIFVLQCLTAPVAAHMVGRAAYRTGQITSAELEVDDLGPAIAAAQDENQASPRSGE